MNIVKIITTAGFLSLSFLTFPGMASPKSNLTELPRDILSHIGKLSGQTKPLRLVSKGCADKIDLDGILTLPADFCEDPKNLNETIPHGRFIRVLDLTKLTNLEPLGLYPTDELCPSLKNFLAKKNHKILCIALNPLIEAKTLHQNLGPKLVNFKAIIDLPTGKLTCRQKYIIGELFNSHRSEGYKWSGQELPHGVAFVEFARRFEGFLEKVPYASRELQDIEVPQAIFPFFNAFAEGSNLDRLIQEMSKQAPALLKRAINEHHCKNLISGLYSELLKLKEEDAFSMMGLLEAYFPPYAPSQLNKSNPDYLYRDYLLHNTSEFPGKYVDRYESDLSIIYLKGTFELKTIVSRSGLMYAFIELLSKTEQDTQLQVLKRIRQILTPDHFAALKVISKDVYSYAPSSLSYSALLARLQNLFTQVTESIERVTEEQFDGIAQRFLRLGVNPLEEEGIWKLSALILRPE